MITEISKKDIAQIISDADTPNAVVVAIKKKKLTVNTMGEMIIDYEVLANDVKGIMQPIGGVRNNLPEGIRESTTHVLYLQYDSLVENPKETYYIECLNRIYVVQYIENWSAFLKLYLKAGND